MRSLLLASLTVILIAAEPAEQATGIAPPVIGSQLPDTPVSTTAGERMPLSQAVGAGKAVLLVYRGGWCPVCTRHFSALGPALQELDEEWTLVALSPDTPANIAAWEAKHGADRFTRLSDSSAAAITALGLGFRVDEATRTVYQGYGIDLEQASGHDHHILPVPTVLLVVDGEVRFVHADSDYRRRLAGEVLTAAAAMVEQHEAEAAKRQKNK